MILIAERTIAIAILAEEAFDDTGYTIEELVMGLSQVIVNLAGPESDLLDEAIRFIGDGGVVFDEEEFDDDPDFNG